MDEEAEGGAATEVDAADSGPCSSICSSLCFVCVGILLFPCSLALLGWNENSYVCEGKGIQYGERHAEVVGCDRRTLSGDGLFFFSCPVVPSSLEKFEHCKFNGGPCGDGLLGFSSVSGKQVAEMYICKEECHTKKRRNGAGQNEKVRTCSYSMAWSTSPGRTSFERSVDEISTQGCPDFATTSGNPSPPTGLRLGSTSLHAETVLVGESEAAAYRLNAGLVHQLPADSPVALAPYARNFTGKEIRAEPWTRPFNFSDDELTVSGNYLMSCTQTRLGCIRISYFESTASQPSVIAYVTKSTGAAAPEMIPGSWGCSARPWQAILPASVSKGEMIGELWDRNHVRVWLLRLLGLFLACLSVLLCLQPIAMVAELAGSVLNFLPCGGYLQDALEGMAQGILLLLSCSVGCSVGLLVIAIVWLFMRPIISLLLLACCLALGGVAMYAQRMHAKDKTN